MGFRQGVDQEYMEVGNSFLQLLMGLEAMLRCLLGLYLSWMDHHLKLCWGLGHACRMGSSTMWMPMV